MATAIAQVESENVVELNSEAAEVVMDALVNDDWACLVCTFLNDESVNVCQACDSSRPIGGGGEPSPPSSASAGWWCTVCTFINGLSESRYIA